MEILICIAVGTIASGVAAALSQSARANLNTSLTVGILGGLLGLAADFWLAAGGFTRVAFSESLASATGATITLTLWIVAQRLFVASPSENAVGETTDRESPSSLLRSQG
ncbi:MAG: hypothetical protein AAGD11_04055 [Planctomycetota bacterium]